MEKEVSLKELLDYLNKGKTLKSLSLNFGFSVNVSLKTFFFL